MINFFSVISVILNRSVFFCLCFFFYFSFIFKKVDR